MKRNAVATLFFLIAGGWCFAQSDQPLSLAELAKQNKPDKKKAHVVVTEDDLQSSLGIVSVVGDDSTKPAPSPEESAAQKKAGDNNQAASSKGNAEVADLKKKLDSFREQQDGWKRSAKHYEDLLASDTNDFRRETYQTALANDRVNVKLFQQKIDQAQADLSKAQQSAATTKSSPSQTPANPEPAGSPQ